MKKIILIFSLSLCFSSLVYGQDQDIEDDAESAPNIPSWMNGEDAALSTGRRESRRLFEFGLLDLNFSGVLDGVDLFGGLGFDPAKLDTLNVELDILTTPLYFRIPVGNVFDLDVFTGADVDVKLNLPQKTIDALKDIESLTDTNNIADLGAYIAKIKNMGGISGGMSAGASAFTEFGVGVSKTFLNNRLWVRAAPSLFFTLFYMKQSSISMTGYTEGTKFGLKAEGSMHLYSAWDLKNGDVNPFAGPGLDITLESCYALWPILDLGLLISHIPIAPSKLTHRMTVAVDGLSMFFDTNDPKSILTFDAPDLDNMITSGDDSSLSVIRPVRFDIYGLVKPFRSLLLVVRPNIGATVNTIFADAVFNWGLTVQYNASNIFSAFIGTGLTESVWSQRAGIALDFRVFELDLAVALAGATFTESWSGNGLILSTALKFGF
jgi:hypothetical protein